MGIMDEIMKDGEEVTVRTVPCPKGCRSATIGQLLLSDSDMQPRPYKDDEKPFARDQTYHQTGHTCLAFYAGIIFRETMRCDTEELDRIDPDCPHSLRAA